MFLITGATGNVGRPLIDALLALGAPVRALTRRPADAGLPDGVEVAATDDLPMDGVRAVFLNAMTVQHAAGPLLKKAAEHGVRRVVVLSSLSALDDDPDNTIAVSHRDLERAVEESGLEWTFLRPGAFASNTLSWAGSIRSQGVARAAYGAARFSLIHERDIAEVAARALLDDDLVGAKPALTGPESLTQVDQARVIGEAIGRPVRFEEITPEEARTGMIGSYIPPAIADTLLRMFAQLTERPAEISPDFTRITGRPARTFAEWAADHAADFR
ncbi:NAD(P)H-binding protein [Actinoallomurus purpureus]|uniref:NAD(P)H-binding protein n=1 Tax=Actinoallomurus purpureus TaxID=478114 RepID=UPI002093A2C7|nr:NAD(P)H-binding protein [Actinoallomurus purpureus]MCO6004977.1 NAD(P)H-binding protein [Actinoallomurus purpureus]